jgi:hypothetical protein
MKTKIWHNHVDDTPRMQAYLLACGFEVEVVYNKICPPLAKGEVMFLLDGPWVDTIPEHLRSQCVFSLTHLYEGHMAFRVKQGFKACIAREPIGLKMWPHELKAIMPPYVACPDYDRTAGVGEIVGMVHDQDKRDPEGYAWAKKAGILVLGTESPTWDALDVFRTLRWLWHVKTVGYICNAVVKALVCGVPILMNQRTFDLGGYDSFLIPDMHVLIRDTPEELKEAALHLPSEKWEEMSWTCRASRDYFCQVQLENISELRDLVKRVGGEG